MTNMPWIMNNDIRYSVRIKNGAGWRAYDTVRLMISVGAPYHEGMKFAALVDWLNRSANIKHVIVSVNDTLQRYNLIAGGVNDRAAKIVALAEGAMWLARVQDSLSDLKKPYSISRWNEWIDRPDFPQHMQLIGRQAESNPDFTSAIMQDIEGIISRWKARGIVIGNEAAFREQSINYIKEESAVFNMMTLDCDAAEIYPGSELASALYFNTNPVIPGLEGLAKRYFTRIDFARLKAGDKNAANDQAALLASTAETTLRA
ncbi:MAG: hypothetical protein WDO70_01390 [Alphaproteobacteria bacterium]